MHISHVPQFPGAYMALPTVFFWRRHRTCYKVFRIYCTSYSSMVQTLLFTVPGTDRFYLFTFTGTDITLLQFLSADIGLIFPGADIAFYTVLLCRNCSFIVVWRRDCTPYRFLVHMSHVAKFCFGAGAFFIIPVQILYFHSLCTDIARFTVSVQM